MTRHRSRRHDATGPVRHAVRVAVAVVSLVVFLALALLAALADPGGGPTVQPATAPAPTRPSCVDVPVTFGVDPTVWWTCAPTPERSP